MDKLVLIQVICIAIQTVALLSIMIVLKEIKKCLEHS